MLKSNMALSKLGAAPPKAFLQKLGEDPEKVDKTELPPLARIITEKAAGLGKQNRAQSLIQVGDLKDYAAIFEMQKLQQKQPIHAQRKSVNASTQVFTQGQAGRYSSCLLTVVGTCDFNGCTEDAIAGVCDYRVCCSRGCKRQLCSQHHAATAKRGQLEEQEEEIDDFSSAHDKTNYMDHVCVECESRANRAFWITIFIVILIPLMAVMPAIILYGGNSQSA